MPSRAATSASVAVAAGTTDATAIALTPWSAWSSSARRSRSRISSSSAVLARVVAARRTDSSAPSSTMPRVRFVFPMSTARSMPRSYVGGMAPPRRPASLAAMRDARHVVIVGGGRLGHPDRDPAAPARRAGAGGDSGRAAGRLGQGVAFGTPDPWHRLNVPAVTMSGLSRTPTTSGSGRACPRTGSPTARHTAATSARCSPRRGAGRRWRSSTSGRASTAVNATGAGGRPSRRHARGRRVARGGRDRHRDRQRAAGDPVVPARRRGERRPAVRARPVGGGGARGGDARRDGAHRRHGPHGDGPRRVVIRGPGSGGSSRCPVTGSCREPTRTRGARVRPAPAVHGRGARHVADPIEEAASASGAHPDGWRQGLDSLRPIHRDLWLRSRRARPAAGSSPTSPRLGDPPLADLGRRRPRHRGLGGGRGARDPGGGPVRYRPGRASGSRRRPAPGRRPTSCSRPGRRVAVGEPAPRRARRAGVGRPGRWTWASTSTSYRLLDPDGGSPRPVYALGPLIRGAVWETIAVPEIRVEAVAIAEQVMAGA